MTIRNPRLLFSVVLAASLIPLLLRWARLQTVLAVFHSRFSRRIFRGGEEGSARGMLYASTLLSMRPWRRSSQLCVVRTLLFVAVRAPFSSQLSVIYGMRGDGSHGVLVGHCWLEDEEGICGDTAAACSLYTPIIAYRAPFNQKQLVA